MKSSSIEQHLLDCSLDPVFLGECVGAGAGHVVYKYGENSVVKIPRFRWAKHKLSIITADDAQKNLQHAQKHFGDFIPETIVHRSAKDDTYCFVQDWLPTFTNLNAKDVTEHVEIAKQFSCILKKNQELITNEGLCVDFFGQEGFIKTFLAGIGLFHPQMSNLVVSYTEGQPHIYIADSQLFEIHNPKNVKLGRRMLAEATRWSYELSRVLAKGTFGRDLRE